MDKMYPSSLTFLKFLVREPYFFILMHLSL